VGGAAPPLTFLALSDSPQRTAAEPLAFEARDEGFFVRGGRYNALLRPTGQLVALRAPTRFVRGPLGRLMPPPTPPRQAGFSVRFVGASGDARPRAQSPLAAVRYLRRSGTVLRRTYAHLRFDDVYRGIDVSYHGRAGRLQTDWLVGAGADPARIRIALDGVDAVTPRSDGGLAIREAGLTAFLTKPLAYQTVGRTRRAVDAAWRVDGRTLSFALGRYDHALPIVIDPTLQGTVTVGGTETDTILDIDADTAGNLVAVGTAVDSEFPRVGRGPFAPGGDFDGIIVTLSPSLQVTGTAIVGGSGDDFFQRVDAESPGEWIISGATTSPDLPLSHPVDASYGGGTCAGGPCVDGMLLAFGGGVLRFGTYVGGSLDDQITSIAFDRGARGGRGLLAFGGASNSPQYVRSAGYDDLVGAVQYDSLESLQNGSTYRLQSFGGRGNDAVFGVGIHGDDVYAVGGSRSTSELTPGDFSQFENAFVVVSHDDGQTWQERVFPSAGTYSEFDTVSVDANGAAYAGFIGYFPGGNYGSCSFGKCQPIGFVKLDPSTLDPSGVATIVPPINARYTIQDVDELRTSSGALSGLGAAANAYPTFASSAKPTGLAIVIDPTPRIVSQTALPAGTLAWGAAFAGGSLFLGGAAPEGSFPTVKGDFDGFVAKYGDLGLAGTPASCKCVSIAVRASAAKAARKAVSFTLGWTMTCSGGSGSCEGEVEVEAPAGAKIVRPARAVRCGPRSCTSGAQKGSFRVEATGVRTNRSYTFRVKEWCIVGGVRKALPVRRLMVTPAHA
jgi:hypothetical protein